MPLDGIVYLDHAGTTPMDPKVLEAMLPYFTQLYGNPSSLHTVGQEAPVFNLDVFHWSVSLFRGYRQLPPGEKPGAPEGLLGG